MNHIIDLFIFVMLAVFISTILALGAIFYFDVIAHTEYCVERGYDSYVSGIYQGVNRHLIVNSLSVGQFSCITHGG